MRDADFSSVMPQDGTKSLSAGNVSTFVSSWLIRMFSTHEQRFVLSDSMPEVADVKELVAPRTGERGRAWFKRAKSTAPAPNDMFTVGDEVTLDVRDITVYGKIKGFRKDGAFAAACCCCCRAVFDLCGL